MKRKNEIKTFDDFKKYTDAFIRVEKSHLSLQIQDELIFDLARFAIDEYWSELIDPNPKLIKRLLKSLKQSYPVHYQNVFTGYTNFHCS